MSSNYRVTILEVALPEVTVRFESAHPHIDHPPGEANVAAQVLIEAWLELGSPPHPAAAQLQRLKDLAWGEDTEITEEEFEGRSPNADGYWFRRGDRFYSRSSPDLVKFVVESLRPFKRVTYEVTSDSPPVGTMRLHLSDPELASHLRPGLEWDSAMFDVLPHLGG